jgi:DNA-binding NarL/FixJ family response regulator
VVSLSPRELEVVRLICRGLSQKQMAFELSIRRCTVDTLVRRIRDKTGCHKAATLVMWAVAHEIVNPRLSNRRRGTVGEYARP